MIQAVVDEGAVYREVASNWRYYSGVSGIRTTVSCRSCLVAALLASASGVAALQTTVPAPPRSTIFPLVVAWSTELPAAPAARVGFDATQVYVPLRDGALVAIALADGQPVWNVERATSLRPAVGGGGVFIAEGDRVISLSSASGELQWVAALEAPISTPPLWDTGWLVVGGDNGDVVAFRASDGRELWRRRFDSAVRGELVISGERVYVPLDGALLASLDLLTGEPVWVQSFGGDVGQVLVVGEQVLTGATDNFLYSVALEDGAIRWRWRTGADVVGGPQVDQENIYFVSLDNLLRALDRRTGGQRWRRALPMRPSTGVKIIGDVLLVSGLTSEIVAFFAKDGEPAGSLSLTTELARRAALLAREVLARRTALALLIQQQTFAGLPTVGGQATGPGALTTGPGGPTSEIKEAPVASSTSPLAGNPAGPQADAAVPDAVSGGVNQVPAAGAPSSAVGGPTGIPAQAVQFGAILAGIDTGAYVEPTADEEIDVGLLKLQQVPVVGVVPVAGPQLPEALDPAAELEGPPEYIEWVASRGTSLVLVLATTVAGERHLLAFAPAEALPLVPLDSMPGTILPVAEPPIAVPPVPVD